MANLDVTDVLLDPLFAETGLICERQTQVVGTNGVATNTSSVSRFGGVVTNDAGDVLTRLATGERSVGNIVIHTKFKLVEGAPSRSADIVVWHGRRYTVSSVKDYTHFGRGFVEAKCDLIPVSA